MIDERKLIQEIEEEEAKFKPGGKFKNEKLNAMILAIYKMIKAMVNCQPRLEWIPVKERLPEKDGFYLVSGRYKATEKDGKSKVGSCQFRKASGEFKTSWLFDVEAWMDLPDPWEGPDEDDENL